MASVLVSAADFQKHFVGTNPVSAYAKSIDAASQQLMDSVGGLRTVNDALRLYHIAKGLRERLDTVCGLALERSDELCGGNQVLAVIDAETPWGREIE